MLRSLQKSLRRSSNLLTGNYAVCSIYENDLRIFVRIGGLFEAVERLCLTAEVSAINHFLQLKTE
jgi:hypothetical protein